MPELALQEAAHALGLSVDALRRRIKAHKQEARQDERSRWWVLVDAQAPPMQSLATATQSLAEAQSKIAALEAQLAEAQTQACELTSERDQLRGQVAALNVDVARLTAERDAQTRRADDLAAEHDKTWQMLAALTRQNSDLLARIPQLPAPRPEPSETPTAPRSLWQRITGQ